MLIAKVTPVLSPQRIKSIKREQEEELKGLNIKELNKKVKYHLKKLRGLNYISFFTSNTVGELRKKIIQLQSLPYDHFERFGYLYKRHS